MSVKVEMDFDLTKINLDLSRELNFIGDIIRKDHFQRLEKGKGVNGAGMQPLKTATIRKKGSNKILVDSGKMRKLKLKKATTNNQIAEVHPGKIQKYKNSNLTMSDVGELHQYGTKNLPVREWFGISVDAEQRSLRHIELRIEEEIKNA